uniref:Uncharacterized protein n=1 Tax=Oryza sativa subsp. japonica TaxID=39947 RepID=Q5Z942_ORYSJ|nr:hypothetical protein [Oryza sativa Japonica Group]
MGDGIYPLLQQGLKNIIRPGSKGQGQHATAERAGHAARRPTRGRWREGCEGGGGLPSAGSERGGGRAVAPKRAGRAVAGGRREAGGGCGVDS